MASKAGSRPKRVNSGRRGKDASDGSMQATPTASVESMNADRDRYNFDAVLDNEEVAALSVKPEDLIRLYPPRPPSGGLEPRETQKVLVKEPVASNAQDKKKLKRVGVLQPLPPGTVVPISKQLTFAPSGPRFDEEGTFMGHSILGKPEEFAREIEDKKLVKSASEFMQPPPIVEAKVPKPTHPVEMDCKGASPPREKHALEQWDKRMATRRADQQSLAMRMQSYPENLVMNSGEAYRRFQEQRTLVDRAIPSLGYGKGHRVGSEFWRLPERLGDEETGIHMTLTESEKGNPPDLEFIGVPSVVQNEKGIHVERERRIALEYTRREKCYLNTRRDTLKEALTAIEHLRPDMSELQVIGHSPGSKFNVAPSVSLNMDVTDPEKELERFRLRADSLDSAGSDVDAGSDVEEKTALKGPALKLAGTLLQWAGPPPSATPSMATLSPQLSPKLSALVSPKASPRNSARITRSDSCLRRASRKRAKEQDKACESLSKLPRQKEKEWGAKKGGREGRSKEREGEGRGGMDVGGGGMMVEEEEEVAPMMNRVLLECNAGEIATSYLKMENCGQTAVYYSWEPVAMPNPLGTSQAGNKQRFYFDTRGGVLLPGEVLDFPFHFKSRNPGIFSERWLLATSPVLNRGRQLMVTLKGVSWQDDIYKERRDEIEGILVHREAVAAAERIIERVVNGVRTPPRTPKQLKKVSMEEDVFREKNPEMFYHHNIVQQLKHLHDIALYPDHFQDLSAGSLTPTSFPSRGGDRGDKGGGAGGGVKKDDRSGGISKRGGGVGTGKEKRGAKIKEEPEVIPAVVHELPPEMTKWDLSIPGLLKVVMDIEDELLREEKLKQLNQLASALSFPPQPVLRTSPYHFCYLSLCEAVDCLVDVSSHLCQLMGLPSKDWSERGAKRGVDDHNVLSVPGSPIHGKALKGGDKRSGGKEKREVKKPASREREKTPTVKTRKQPKGSSSPKAGDGGANEADVATPVELLDPIQEQKYIANFHASVHQILGDAVERMVVMIESAKAPEGSIEEIIKMQLLQ